MSTYATFHPLSQAEAEQLCAGVRAANRRRWFSAAYWQCWGCMCFTGGDPARRCMGSRLDWRGCGLINELRAGREANQETDSPLSPVSTHNERVV